VCQVKCPIFLPSFNQIWIFSNYFIEVPNIKFHGNPSSGSGANIRGQKDRQTEELTCKRTGSFSDFEKAPESVRRAIDFRMRKFQKDARQDIVRRLKTGTQYETRFIKQRGVMACSPNSALIAISGYIHAPSTLYPTMQIALPAK